MPDRIVIEGSIVRRERIEVLAESSLASLAPHLTTRLATTLPVLPQTPTRYIHFDPEAGSGLIVVETAPKRHVIQVQHHSGRYAVDAARRDPDGKSRFNVMLPYQLFAYSFNLNMRGAALSGFTINSSYLFWAKDPVREPDARLWIAPVPNVDSAGSICWGSTNSDSSSLSARIDDLVNNFYVTTFNEDLGHRTPFGTSITDWENASGTALGWRDWDFWTDQTPMAISELAGHIGTAPPTNIAELNPSFVAIPPLPQDFTVSRAQDWLTSLNPGAHRRLLAAMASVPVPEPEEVEA